MILAPGGEQTCGVKDRSDPAARREKWGVDLGGDRIAAVEWKQAENLCEGLRCAGWDGDEGAGSPGRARGMFFYVIDEGTWAEFAGARARGVFISASRRDLV